MSNGSYVAGRFLAKVRHWALFSGYLIWRKQVIPYLDGNDPLMGCFIPIRLPQLGGRVIVKVCTVDDDVVSAFNPSLVQKRRSSLVYCSIYQQSAGQCQRPSVDVFWCILCGGK